MTQTIIIDPDTVSMVLDKDERSRERDRDAIREIADRLEALLAERGLAVAVEREYRTTGRRDASSEYHREVESVLVGQADEIRRAVLETP